MRKEDRDREGEGIGPVGTGGRPRVGVGEVDGGSKGGREEGDVEEEDGGGGE